MAAGHDVSPAMHVLVLGASGFIGQRLVPALRSRGHHVLAASRHAPAHDPDAVAVDMASLVRPADWHGLLDGVQAVVNAVGIFQEHGAQTFERLHVDAPIALFEACQARGVRRVIQLSAVGADDGAASSYHRSKRAADDALRRLPLAGTVVQPSLVFGPGGASARLFSRWAALPLVPVPGHGLQQVQPVHVDDVVAALVALVEDPSAMGETVPLVGPEPLALKDYLARLRTALGLGAPRFWHVPMGLVRRVTAWSGRLQAGLADPEALAMLERGNTADPSAIRHLLGGPPRPVQQFFGAEAPAWRAWALAGWTLPLLRLAVAAVWIVTGLLSLGIFPTDQSRVLLARVGAEGALATLLLYGAAVFDLLLGVATLVVRRSQLLWAAQVALILGYTALITWRLPEFWLHPFGPILKNVPILAAIAVLWSMEERR